jgi:hypothetical protein
VLASLNSQLSQLTGEGEDLAACTKSYRQCIFKLNHKMNKLNGQVSRVVVFPCIAYHEVICSSI